MMTAREQFVAVLAEFSAASGIELRLGVDNVAVLERGETVISLVYLPESEQVVAWTTLGFLADDANAPRRVRLLLQWNDDPAVTNGFTFGLDEEEGRVVVHDRRSVRFLDNADRLAAWLGILVDLVAEARDRLDREAPFVDDGPLEPEIELVEG